MNNAKIILHAICTSMLLSGALFHQNSFSMDTKKEKKRVKVSSHGFGEDGSGKGPRYPDAPGQLLKACFYTKPAVHTLADYLKDKVDEGYDAVDLEARSCGAGTAVNCLDKLIHYEKNPNYFS